jgi:hypothetical protein
MRTLSAGEVRRALAASERGSKAGAGGGIGAWLKRGAIAAGVLLCMTLLTGWALGWYSTPPQVLEVRTAINEQIAELDKMSKGQTPYSGGPDMGRVRDSMRNLPEGMRDQVRRDFGRLMEAGETAQVNSFFLVAPAQRQAELDRRIKAEDDARKKRAEDRAKGGNRGSPRGTAGGPPGGGRPGGSQVAGNGGPGGGGSGGRGPGGGGPGGGGGPSRGGFSEDDRNNRRKSMLDNSDPEQRGRRAEYRRQLEERRQQLGGGTGGRSR